MMCIFLLDIDHVENYVDDKLVPIYWFTLLQRNHLQVLNMLLKKTEVLAKQMQYFSF